MLDVKVVLVGDTSVGKTCIADRALSGTFTQNSTPTVGARRFSVVTTALTTVPLEIWDTAGQDQYRNLVPVYFRNAMFVVVVCDLSTRTSFDSLDDWVRTIHDRAPEDCEVVMVGNKSDLVDERQITSSEFEDNSYRLGASWCMEVSALTGENISELFDRIAGDAVASGRVAQELSCAIDGGIKGGMKSMCCA
jgi:small GTP-binding protein